MCTAITYRTKNLYFGRTLDLEYHYKEGITVTPRKYCFDFGTNGKLGQHYAMIGVATVADGYPLYYDAVNEKGLCAAGLSFPKSAKYNASCPEKDNIGSYEFIPWMLSQSASLLEARDLIAHINITDKAFSDSFEPTPLHWMIADREGAVVIEATQDGVKLYDNPVGVLTNEPEFEYHMQNLNNYMSLSPNPPVNSFASQLPLCAYSGGMGAIGLPGDASSMSRFIRAAFTKLNSASGDSEDESVSQFFHILASVTQIRGCVRLMNLGGEKYNRTVYTSCCNADKGIYYYTTYESARVVGVDMYREEVDGASLVSYPLEYESNLEIIN